MGLQQYLVLSEESDVRELAGLSQLTPGLADCGLEVVPLQAELFTSHLAQGWMETDLAIVFYSNNE